MRWLLPLVLSGSGCFQGTASDLDCEALGDKFVELYLAEQTEDSLALGPEVLAAAAATGRAEVVGQCRTKATPKRTVHRCLEAASMAEFREC